MKRSGRSEAKRARILGSAAWLAVSLAGAACAPGLEVPDDFLVAEQPGEENRPLGGEALAQRRQELRRAHRDMVHFYETLESLHHRKDRNGFILFRAFCDEYIGTHLNPLLRAEWQSDHPELMGQDANLRFIKAAVLLQMREPRRAQHVIDTISERFEGREDILVDYPIGEQSTLQEALELLAQRKWRG